MFVIVLCWIIECIQDILQHDDITGLLGPSLKALKAAHAVTTEMSAAGKLVLTNMKSVPAILLMLKKRKLPINLQTSQFGPA